MSQGAWAPLNRAAIDARSAYLTEAGIWPAPPHFDPRGWLQNFGKHDLDFAYALLNAFTYIPDKWTDQIFRSGLQRLATEVCDPSDAYVKQQREWRSFLRSSVFTYVTGEHPNPTDSGYAFARKARDVCRIDETSILHPDEAFAAARDHAVSVIFVDDFVGSASQVTHTWNKLRSQTHPRSFAEIAAASSGARFLYAPLVATSFGNQVARQLCHGLRVLPSHVLDSSYSVFEPHSSVWPTGMQEHAIKFLRRMAVDIGLPDTGGQHVNDWQGFAKLGLCFSFAHSLPDATLPIFYWEEAGWKPLKTRPPAA